MTTEELYQALKGKSAEVTFADGTMCNGRIIDVRADSVMIWLEDSSETVHANKDSIYTIAISKCLECWIAGEVVGVIVGLAATPWKNNTGYGIVFPTYGLLGGVVGGTVAGIMSPDKRFLFGSITGARDTLRLGKGDVVSNTGKQITVHQDGKSVTYDKKLVKVLERGNEVLLIRPAERQHDR
jgi:hypothetical protein